MRVECEVAEITLYSAAAADKEIPAVCVTCTRCDHSVEVYGTEERSVKRGLATLREECPEGEKNFYVAEDD